MLTRRFMLAAAALAALSPPAAAQDKSIVVSSTTSTQDSGLFGHILPLFKAKTGIEVKVLSQGTGQALYSGRRGDADVVFVHAKEQDITLVNDVPPSHSHPVSSKQGFSTKSSSARGSPVEAKVHSKAVALGSVWLFVCRFASMRSALPSAFTSPTNHRWGMYICTGP